MKDKIYNSMQKFSRAIIQPVMFMAVAGILIALAALLRLEFMPKFLITVGEFINNVVVGGMIANLSVIFCVGIATALVKDKKGDTATIATISFLIFLFANNFWLNYTNSIIEPTDIGLAGTGQAKVLGVQVTDMGVFIGILLGCIVGYVVNKTKDIKYHEYLSMYEGTKTSFVAMLFVASTLGVLVTYIWPFFNTLLTKLMVWISDAGPVGFFIYGIVNRLALPFGLHHLLWVPMSYSPVGGSAVINGTTYYGAQNIWFAELANMNSITEIDPSIGSLVNFGYTAIPLGIAFALVHTAKKENKDQVKALMIPAVASSMLAGITEPIEFIFLFSSPLLWIAHTLVYGFGMFLSSILGLRVFVGNIIETILYVLSVPMDMGRQWLIPIIFIVLTSLEYTIFVFMIKKFNLNTIGRTEMPDEQKINEAKEKRDRMKGKSNNSISNNIDEDDAKTALIVDGLGGKDNIKYIENCFTRLRIELKDPNKVDREILDLYPSKGILQSGNNIQIVIGLGVEEVKNKVVKELEKE